MVEKRKNKSQARRRYASDNQASGGSSRNLVIGVLVGLIIGVSVAVGLAMYLNKSSTPFTNLERFTDKREGIASGDVPETLAPGTHLLDASQQHAITLPSLSEMNAVADAADRESSAVRAQEASQHRSATLDEDDVYRILSGQQEVEFGRTTSATRESSRAPVVKAEPYLQVGIFKSEQEADNIKAKLALIDVAVSIQSIELPEQGLVHRVKAGPFKSDEEMQSVRAQLKLNGIDVIVKR